MPMQLSRIAQLASLTFFPNGLEVNLEFAAH
jgi:hypothetical protein